MLREGICDTYNGYNLRLTLIQDDECFFKNCFSIEKNGKVILDDIPGFTYCEVNSDCVAPWEVFRNYVDGIEIPDCDRETIEKRPLVARVEVIDGTGRGYVKYLDDTEFVWLSYQDDGRTLKVFIEGE